MHPAPTPPANKVLCDPASKAPLQAEPAPPEGVDPQVLHDALTAYLGPVLGDQMFEWAIVIEPAWGRAGWRRAEAAQTACQAQEAEPVG